MLCRLGVQDNVGTRRCEAHERSVDADLLSLVLKLQRLGFALISGVGNPVFKATWFPHILYSQQVSGF